MEKSMERDLKFSNKKFGGLVNESFLWKLIYSFKLKIALVAHVNGKERACSKVEDNGV